MIPLTVPGTGRLLPFRPDRQRRHWLAWRRRHQAPVTLVPPANTARPRAPGLRWSARSGTGGRGRVGFECLGHLAEAGEDAGRPLRRQRGGHALFDGDDRGAARAISRIPIPLKALAAACRTPLRRHDRPAIQGGGGSSALLPRPSHPAGRTQESATRRLQYPRNAPWHSARTGEAGSGGVIAAAPGYSPATYSQHVAAAREQGNSDLCSAVLCQAIILAGRTFPASGIAQALLQARLGNREGTPLPAHPQISSIAPGAEAALVFGQLARDHVEEAGGVDGADLRTGGRNILSLMAALRNSPCLSSGPRRAHTGRCGGTLCGMRERVTRGIWMPQLLPAFCTSRRRGRRWPCWD